jgi:hypothetical protein
MGEQNTSGWSLVNESYVVLTRSGAEDPNAKVREQLGSQLRSWPNHNGRTLEGSDKTLQ